MNIRFTIALAYSCLLLWGWDFALGEGSTELTERIIPMFGFMLLVWVIHRLECMAKEQKKKQTAESGSTTEQTTTNRPNEA